MPSDQPIKLSIVITGKNIQHLVRQAYDSFRHIEDINYEALYVDNVSDDDTISIIENEYPHVRIIRNPKNLGFAGANNRGIEASQGEYVLLINSDAELLPNSVQRCLAAMDANPKIGVLGCVLLNSDGSFQGGYGTFPDYHTAIRNLTGRITKDYQAWKKTFSYDPPERSVDWISGAYFLIRRATLEDIGLLDERYFFYFEEVDFCYRTHQAGWDVHFLSDVEIMHHHRQTTRKKGTKISSLASYAVRSQLIYAWSYYSRSQALRLMLLAIYISLGMTVKGIILSFTDRNRLTSISNGLRSLVHVFQTFGGIKPDIPRLSGM